MRCSIKEGVLVLLQNTPFPVLTHKCGQLDTRNERGVASDVEPLLCACAEPGDSHSVGDDGPQREYPPAALCG